MTKVTLCTIEQAKCSCSQPTGLLIEEGCSFEGESTNVNKVRPDPSLRVYDPSLQVYKINKLNRQGLPNWTEEDKRRTRPNRWEP